MADWTTNTIMLWNGNKITDHGRDTLNMTIERIGSDRRMADSTLRRFHIGNKRTWNATWNMIPSSNTLIAGIKTADGGWAGEDMENFYNTTPGAFKLVLRRGSAIGLSLPDEAADINNFDRYEDDFFYGCGVMLTEFSKDVVKRGMVDFWNISVTLEEV